LWLRLTQNSAELGRTFRFLGLEKDTVEKRAITVDRKRRNIETATI
jgi:hypothetical protein